MTMREVSDLQHKYREIELLQAEMGKKMAELNALQGAPANVHGAEQSVANSSLPHQPSQSDKETNNAPPAPVPFPRRLSTNPFDTDFLAPLDHGTDPGLALNLTAPVVQRPEPLPRFSLPANRHNTTAPSMSTSASFITEQPRLQFSSPAARPVGNSSHFVPTNAPMTSDSAVIKSIEHMTNRLGVNTKLPKFGGYANILQGWTRTTFRRASES